MGRYTDITLIKIAKSADTYGDWAETEVRRTVYAEEMSVSQTEFYQGYAVGFKPEVKFILSNWLDYRGEEIIEYTPYGYTEVARLRVLRVYNAGDTLELTCYKDNEEPKVPTPEPEPTPDPTPTPPDPEEGGEDNADTEEPSQDQG